MPSPKNNSISPKETVKNYQTLFTIAGYNTNLKYYKCLLSDNTITAVRLSQTGCCYIVYGSFGHNDVSVANYLISRNAPARKQAIGIGGKEIDIVVAHPNKSTAWKMAYDILLGSEKYEEYKGLMQYHAKIILDVTVAKHFEGATDHAEKVANCTKLRGELHKKYKILDVKHGL